MSITTWVPTTSPTVFALSSANRPTTDVDGGPLGRDPASLAAGVITVPVTLSDPSLALIEPSQPAWETPFLFGKWGSSSAAAPVTLTYSFYETGSPAIGSASQAAPLDAAHRNAIRSGFAAFADITNLTFVEVAETAQTIGQLRFIDDRALDNNTFTAAYTSMPLIGDAESGLVAFDVDRFGVTDDVSRGGLVYGMMVHEIGHALGLTHSFDADDVKPSAGDPRATSGQWHTGWTMMAYTRPGADLLPSGQRHDPIGPMIADVAVLQAYYGANRTTRTGDDVYHLDGRYPAAALWDAGGTDTIDASQAAVTLPGEQGTGAVLRRPGDPLPAGATYFTTWSGIDLDLRPGQITPHVAIAFGTAIENAIGSRGHDRITGTDPGVLTAGDGTTTTTSGNNRLDGGAGDDTILGLGGDDTLIGGSGNNLLDGGAGDDTTLFGVASTAVTVAVEGTDLIVTGAGFVDRMRGIEHLGFTDRTITAADAPTLLAPTTPTPPTTPSTPTTPQPVVIDPGRRLAITVGGVAKEFAMDRYVGPVGYLQNSFVGSDDVEAIAGTPNADFINSRGGMDAIDGGAGDDVLDGGTESNFLTGGAGWDTFFVDGRGGGVTWSTVTDLEKGEWVTAWGWRPGVSKMTWEEMAGAEGAKGATARIDLNGNGSIDMSMTIAGKTSGAIFTSPGQVGDSAYLAFAIK
ncbi:M10 family metallopeptidase [Azospirillum canadense]|uniref:M10 family metallopeptidase n=1 Tax=Azospirillum canadense TaxID=403962 RepID=UPI002227652F|nr:M10 family metallopeptidase [Azospirillum canadense]MCW2240777.1 serralysin [Azospirillum canadense]